MDLGTSGLVGEVGPQQVARVHRGFAGERFRATASDDDLHQVPM
jgi:hypothetical protein